MGLDMGRRQREWEIVSNSSSSLVEPSLHVTKKTTKEKAEKDNAEENEEATWEPDTEVAEKQ